jgi:hypothetical protein
MSRCECKNAYQLENVRRMRGGLGRSLERAGTGLQEHAGGVARVVLDADALTPDPSAEPRVLTEAQLDSEED